MGSGEFDQGKSFDAQCGQRRGIDAQGVEGGEVDLDIGQLCRVDRSKEGTQPCQRLQQGQIGHWLCIGQGGLQPAELFGQGGHGCKESAGLHENIADAGL